MLLRSFSTLRTGNAEQAGSTTRRESRSGDPTTPKTTTQQDMSNEDPEKSFSRSPYVDDALPSALPVYGDPIQPSESPFEFDQAVLNEIEEDLQRFSSIRFIGTLEIIVCLWQFLLILFSKTLALPHTTQLL